MKTVVIVLSLLITSLSLKANELENSPMEPVIEPLMKPVAEKISLQTAIERSNENNLDLDITRNSKNEFLVKNSEVKAKFSPKIKTRVGLGPITEERGNALSSQETKGKFGVAYLGEIELTWPIFTWNRERDILQAIEKGKKAFEADIKSKQLEIHYQVKEAYYGVLLAYSFKDFIFSQKEKVEKIIDDNKDKFKKTDKYQSELFLNQIKQKENQVNGLLETALLGLKYRTGSKTNVRPIEDWIESSERELKEFSYYEKQLVKKHHQFQKIQSGIAAKDLLIKAEKKGLYPALAVFAKYSWAEAQIRDTQTSAFAYDPYNRSDILLGVGFEWNYQWGEVEANIDKLKAEKNTILLQQKLANSGLNLLLKKAWLKVKESEEQARLARKAHKTSKKWLNRELLSAGVGLGNIKKLANVFKTRASTAKDYFESIYSLELAWASFDKALGYN